MIETYKKRRVCLCLNGHIAALVYLKNNNLPEQIYIDKSHFFSCFSIFTAFESAPFQSVFLFINQF